MPTIISNVNVRRIRRFGAYGSFRGLACQRLGNAMQLVLDWPWIHLGHLPATFFPEKNLYG